MIFNYQFSTNIFKQENLKALNAYDRASWLIQNKFFLGIGHSLKWSYVNGTGVDDYNPPVPFLHNDNLFFPLLYKQCLYAAPVVDNYEIEIYKNYADNSLNPENTNLNNSLICKKIPAVNYVLSDREINNRENLEYLVLNKYLFESNKFIDFNKIYFEIYLSGKELQQYNIEEFRELGLFVNPNIIQENAFNYRENKIYFNNQIESATSPVFLSYSSPFIVEPLKDLSLKFIVNLDKV